MTNQKMFAYIAGVWNFFLHFSSCLSKPLLARQTQFIKFNIFDAKFYLAYFYYLI